ncbi:unnamed protein product [Aureobasidium mustum]|uniref:SRR1-like domain-containing protein n=1 Tax=Aureobasidium mustum TaxID=2773714 RepID=A0A9N8JT20_9PEZI|nr:unnamed protein product [Aureobasidium mustum]
MASIPPNKPRNPYPLPPHRRSGQNGPVGINFQEWNENIQEWLEYHPGFLPETYLADGQPANGQFPVIWNKIMAVTRLLMNDQAYLDTAGPLGDIERVRADLRTVVERAGYIKNAVCLGLGSIQYQSPGNYKHHYVQQCGLFFALCKMIEEKQDMTPGSLPTIFQDPAFQLEDRYILEEIGGQTIVEHPEANNYMNGQSFVYAPHFPFDHLFDTILGEGHEPELLYTNTFHGSLGSIGWLITDSYLKKVYWTRDTTVDQKSVDMYNVATRFLETREGIVYWGDYAHPTKNGELSIMLRKAFPDLHSTCRNSKQHLLERLLSLMS